jgi:hypothetical protein
MLIIGEYLNLSRTDIKSLLSTTSDRKKTLEGFINQLELRQKNSRTSMQSLEQHKALLVTQLDSLSAQIEVTKTNMETSFSA